MIEATEQEVWVTISEFPSYSISNMGNIFNNRTERPMSISYSNHGHAKITLAHDWTRRRHTRPVAQLVAEAFVESPNILCDQVILLDGDLSNVAAHNLTWRPRWYAWKYTRQLKEEQPIYYRNLPTYNVTDDEEYDCIVEAGMAEGVLFDDIWESTYSGKPIFPYGCVYEIIERV